jgi:hypothetical protein
LVGLIDIGQSVGPSKYQDFQAGQQTSLLGQTNRQN